MAEIKITFYLGTASYLLCNTTRTLAESGIMLNGERLLRFYNLLEADNARVLDGKNQRNILSFSADRQEDFAGDLFKDEAAAFVFALDLLPTLQGVGKVKLEVAGDVAAYTRWIGNVAVKSADLTKLEGVSMTHRFVLNGGVITKTEPSA